ncbi:MAG: IgGFc-binding protein [bacterium]|nr:IgGFc-binding protein [Candidatus Kapabacteria bacterium]
MLRNEHEVMAVDLDTLSLLHYNPRQIEISKRTLRLTFSADVTVHGLNGQRWSSDAFLALPVSALGAEYMVAAYPNTLKAGQVVPDLGVSDFPSQFCIVATDDNTLVTIQPTAHINNRISNEVFTITLQRGEAFIAQAAGGTGTDLTGTRVSSSKSVAVFGGHQRANVPYSGAVGRDHLVEQLLPLHRWRTHMIAVSHRQLNWSREGRGVDIVRIMASESNTTVSISGFPNRTMSAGEVIEISLTTPRVITATKPVYANEFKCSATDEKFVSVPNDSIADPFMTTVVPPEYFDTAYTFRTMGGKNQTRHFLNIIVARDEWRDLRLDGKPLVGNTVGAIEGTRYEHVDLEIAAGAHRLTGRTPFGAMAYGYGVYNSYGYPLGMVFDPIPLRVDESTDYSFRLTLSPNPAVDDVHLSLMSTRRFKARVDIVNARGVVVATHPSQSYDAGSSRIRIDCTGFASGVYVARLFDERGVRLSRVFSVVR